MRKVSPVNASETSVFGVLMMCSAAMKVEEKSGNYDDTVDMVAGEQMEGNSLGII